MEHTHQLGVGLQAIRDSGLLWALNTGVLHGRGYEARVDGDQLIIVGYGERVRQWTPEQTEPVDRSWRQFEQTLLDARTKNNPAYHAGHSPGFGAKGRTA